MPSAAVMAVSGEGEFSRVPPPPGLYKPMSASDNGPSPAFKQLLERNAVHTDVSSWLFSQGCTQVQHLANWVDSKTELREGVLDKTSKKDDISQLACLKQAWREAEAQTNRNLRRTQESLPQEDLDSPLDSEEQKSVEQRFRSLYSWPSLPARCVGSDSLLGRVKREFDRRQPTQYPVSRVKTLASTQRGAPSKSRRLSAGVALTFEGADEEEVCVSGVYGFLTLLRVLCTTWAVAGSFDTPEGGGKFAHWHETTEYEHAFSEKAHQELSLHTEESVVAWISAMEENVRAHAIELTRGPLQSLWGKALLTSLKELSSKWGESRHLLVPRRAPPRHLGRLTHRTADWPPPEWIAKGLLKGAGKGKVKGKSKGKEPGGQRVRGWKTCSHTSAGVPICKRFNDPRGCAQACPSGSAHCCDVQMRSGAPCSRRDHCRQTHNPQAHGAPSPLASTSALSLTNE